MIRQRVKLGLKRAVANGKRLGRPQIDSELERKAQRELTKGKGILAVAKQLGLGTGTVPQRHRTATLQQIRIQERSTCYRNTGKAVLTGEAAEQVVIKMCARAKHLIFSGVFHFVRVQVPSYRLSLDRYSEMKLLLLVVEKCPCSDPSSS